MADNPNPFILALGSTRSRTLAEIEAANRLRSCPSLAIRPSGNESTATERPSQQQHAVDLNNGFPIPMNLDQPRTPRSNRHNPIVISDDEDQENDERPVRLPKTQRPIKRAHKGKKKRHHTAPDGPASRTRNLLLDDSIPAPNFPFDSKGVKRKVSRGDPDRDVFRDFEAESSKSKKNRGYDPAQNSGQNLAQNPTHDPNRDQSRHHRRSFRGPVIIDLTNGVPDHIWQDSEAAERRRLRRNRDQNVLVAGTPALDMRRELRKLAAGLPRDSNLGIPGASGADSILPALRPVDIAGTPDDVGASDDAGSNDNSGNNSRPGKRPKRGHPGSVAVESPARRQQQQQQVEEVIEDEIVVAGSVDETTPKACRTRTKANARTNTEGNNTLVTDSPVRRRLTSTIDAGTAALLETVQPVCHFFNLSVEIRDKIYRYLLISATPIQVQHLWTQVARRAVVRRTRRGGGGRSGGIGAPNADDTIDNRVMYACRQTAVEGARILYSENTFFYLLRDPEVIKGPSSYYLPDSSPTNAARRSSRGRMYYNSSQRYGLGSTSTSPRKNGSSSRRQNDSLNINLARYGPLIRHMAIELEPNRSSEGYEKLMAAALEVLGPVVPSAGSTTTPNLPRPDNYPPQPFHLHLHTLTITISPRPENRRVYRGLRTEDGRKTMETQVVLKTADFFEPGGRVLTALQRLQVGFLRVCLHVNSDVRDGAGLGSLEGDTTEDDSDDGYYEEGDGGYVDDDDDEGEGEEESDEDEDEEEESDEDDDDDGTIHVTTSSTSGAFTGPKYKHVETTIDLRRVPENSVLATAAAQAGPTADLLSNDKLMIEQRQRAGAEAAHTLATLRQHIEQACDFVREPLPGEPVTAEQQIQAEEKVDSDSDSSGNNSPFMQLLRRLKNAKKTRGIWTEHSIAERKRREAKRREEARFNRDAYEDDEYDGGLDFHGHRDNGDEIAGAGWESLILCIGQVGEEVRVYRA
ncbi:uncharacterized protein C8A04DRAFT_23953 [Dichotomopilus funicola]|uniref:Uncharacterized protein n=1 Tax=Dichotomopilus funicola TaxID=1934379 RepID=A0AAN6VB46_9PEZI|nr:hypothetical protein C8A04DRAFT_23953 [Dichotomopilus funicola]